MNKNKYKKCYCFKESWEEVVVKDDEYYENKTVIYFHCDECGEDFAVEDFYSGVVLYINIDYGT